MESLHGIGPALAVIRKKRGKKQVELAEVLGLSVAAMSRLERASINPTVESVGKYLDALGADAYDLAEALDLVNGRRTERRWPATKTVSLGEGSEFLHSLVSDALLRGLKQIKEEE